MSCLNSVGIIYNGKPYTTLHELARDFNIPLALVLKRLGSGCNFTEALAPVPQRSGYAKRVVYNGKDYPSQRKLCEDLGLHYRSLAVLLDTGSSLECAVEHLLSVKSKREYREKHGLVVRGTYISNDRKIDIAFPLVFDGRDYTNLADIGKHYKINYSTLRSRLSRGWTLEESVFGKKLVIG